jgi:hypothetical protein
MIDPAVIEEQKAKHGTVHLLKAGEHEVIVKRPSRPAWRKFRTLAAEPSKRPDALEGLLRDCLVYPDQKALEAMLEQAPALSELFGNEVMDIAGAGLEVEKNVC